MKALLNLMTLCLLGAVSSPPIGTAQVTHTSADPQSISFDVVSIRPAPSSGPSHLQVLSDGYEAVGVPLLTTLVMAYAPAPYFDHFDDIKGFPSWVANENFDVRAKIAPKDVPAWNKLHQGIFVSPPLLQKLLQQVLVERCRLQIHSEPTLVTGYGLAIERNAIKLRESNLIPGGQTLELAYGGRAKMTTQNGEQIYTFYNTSMAALANFLTVYSKHPVEDRTGLKGHYTFVLRHVVFQTSGTSEDPEFDLPVPWDVKSIGMKIEKIKIKSSVWRVDGISRPTPN